VHHAKLTPAPFSHIPLGPGRWVTVGVPIGRGTLAHVYDAVIDANFGVQKRCALKVFGVIASDEQEAVIGALIDSARKSALVDHPNVAGTLEFGVHAGQPYRIGELVDGASLAELLDRFRERRLRMPLDLALFVGMEVAAGLDGARVAKDDMGRDLRMVHGDVSPREVLLSRHGEVKLSDFGLWAARHMASDVRNIRQVAKRTESMSPEVARGRTPDSRSDVFSLGLLLHEMLVGPRFSRRVSEQEALRLARDGVIEPSTGPQLPRDLVGLLLRALATDPRDRFPTPGAVGFELRRVALSLGVGDMRPNLRTALESLFQEEISGATNPELVLRASSPGRDDDDQRDTRRRLDGASDRRSGAVVRSIHRDRDDFGPPTNPSPPPMMEGWEEDEIAELDESDLEWGGYTDDLWPR